jgi:transcriptional regulator with XRE-family HTH domain
VVDQPKAGALVREWRERRRMSQSDLALAAGISPRHLSFVETGRSKPGRGVLLRILEPLDVPLRDQNQVLSAAGHAPAYPERALDDPELAPVREAVDQVLAKHAPYPAVAVDRYWNLVATNRALERLTAHIQVDPALLEPPVNVLRVGLHPNGLAPLYPDVDEWRAHFCARLERQIAATGDPRLIALLEEIASYPSADGRGGSQELLGPLRICALDGSVLSFVGMFATFDSPFEVTASELAVELLFPADATTAEAFRTGLSATGRPTARTARG